MTLPQIPLILSLRRDLFLANPDQLALMKQNNPRLADAINNLADFTQVLQEQVILHALGNFCVIKVVFFTFNTLILLNIYKFFFIVHILKVILNGVMGADTFPIFRFTIG